MLEIKEQNGKLVVMVTPQDAGLSSTGKSHIFAKTGGFTAVAIGGKQYKLNVTLIG